MNTSSSSATMGACRCADALVLDPAGKLLVNFDKSILTVIREAKWLQRMGMSVPEAAMLLLLQEEKYKLYFNNLQHALQVCLPLWPPHRARCHSMQCSMLQLGHVLQGSTNFRLILLKHGKITCRMHAREVNYIWP